MSISSAPTENAEGRKVWKPEVGIVFEPAFGQQQSYGGIVGALQDAIQYNGGAAKSYPYNFAGIIAAIQDLEVVQRGEPPVAIQPIPPGTEIDINGDLHVIVQPEDGNLWFDSRQGRLFVAADREWWQTNGADGLSYIRESTDPPNTDEVLPGQSWYHTDTGEFYVFDGTNWLLVSGGDGAFQATGSLPLDARLEDPNNPFGWELETATPGYDPAVDPINISNPLFQLMNTQRDYNGWILDSLWDLDQAIESNSASVEVGDQPPLNPSVGDLWFDVNAAEMSIYYNDGNTEQWAPVSVGLDYNELITYINSLITDVSDREIRDVAQLEADIANLKNQLEQADQVILDKIASEISNINIPETDLSGYSRIAYTDSLYTDLADKVSNIDNSLKNTIDAVKEELKQVDLTMSADVQTKASIVDLQATIALIPDISHLESSTTVDEKISAITEHCLSRTGGVINGNLEIQKNDITTPGLDFSAEQYYSHNALVLKAMISGDSTVSFGTTDVDGEVAFNFADKEEFTWKHSVEDKVFSIDRTGVAAENLYLGNFRPNNLDGRVIHNQIDVKDRLTTYQTTFEELRRAVANANDFDELKSELTNALQNV